MSLNLPAGTAMALMDYAVSVSGGENDANLESTKASIDLVSVSYAFAVDLKVYTIDNMVASFF
jgi:hypothetical protein